MELQTLKLGTVTKDKATGLKGTLTHWICDMSKKIYYLFQPEGINPEDGQPVEKLFLELERMEVSDDNFEMVDVPFEILGTEVTDKASGFKGIGVSFVRHVNGCFHVVIQPQGTLPKTNSPIKKMDFDLRQCRGEKIRELAPEELKRSQELDPSPTGHTFPEPISPCEPTFHR